MWWLDPIYATGWLLAGLLLGRGRRRPKTPELRKCSCKHGYSFHRDGKRCQRNDQGYSFSQCACQVYDGEIPLDLFGRA